ncbi:fatty acid desaturase-domain-containing protein [Rhodotorula diobovata]|uniref:sphingolipid 4-desaturase n=1 Tax=Rhodotorula diobovata TaxID=5288 RepID=A0A5C5G166_9BASI|nr:fatty acid desaturase-domain-containing protein [Rhodotorula diobovata]
MGTVDSSGSLADLRTRFDLFGGADELPPSLRQRTANTPQLTAMARSPSSSSSSPSASASDSDEPETRATTPGVDDPLDKSSLRLPGEHWAPRTVHPAQDHTDFLWQMNEEPHRSRRMAIMKAHPEVTKLMGHEPLTKWVVLFVTLVQLSTAVYLRDTPFFSLKFWALAYLVGGTANQNTFLAVHEITHNLAFRGVRANRLFAIFANLPIGVPFAMMFKKYHIEHHKFLGVDGIDTDLPSRLELVVLNSVLGKTFFAAFQIFFYALRPGFIRYQAPTRWIALNWLVQLSFNALVVKTLGWHSMLYFLLSSHLAGSLHPCAGHFIAEHYLFDGHDQETWSYYGPLNILCYNVGLHQEHHDFPAIPWTRLWKLKALAPEFYDVLPSHSSWPGVTWRFITDPNVGMFSRVKRKQKGGRGDEGGGGAGTLANAGGLKDE